jgi:hypothetical protein
LTAQPKLPVSQDIGSAVSDSNLEGAAIDDSTHVVLRRTVNRNDQGNATLDAPRMTRQIHGFWRTPIFANIGAFSRVGVKGLGSPASKSIDILTLSKEV